MLVVKKINIVGLGQKIKAARKKLEGVKTVSQICHELDISRSYYYKIEDESITGALSLDLLRNIENILEVDLLELDLNVVFNK